MFYKLLGRTVWKFGLLYTRRRFARQLKLVGGIAAASLVIGGWLAMRGVEQG